MGELALITGTGLKAISDFKGGKADKEQLDSQANQLRRNAKVRKAASQRDANDERYLGDLAVSQALAAAAASGGGVSNPTVLRLMADLDAEGEYRALSRLYAGEEDAMGMELEARNLNKTGRAAKRRGTMKAASTILTGGGTWSALYG